MPIWGKPNIQSMIQKHDTKGLLKACRDEDYEIRKSALLGLVRLKEILPNPALILLLIVDPDVKIRRVAYTYSLVGDLGLYSLVAALHDVDLGMRNQALEYFHEYHQKRGSHIIQRVSRFDPDISIREKAQAFVELISNDVDEPVKINTSFKDEYKSWLSNEALFDDLLILINKDKQWNPGYIGKSGMMFPYSSPLMVTCESNFKEARRFINSDKSRVNLLLNNVMARAVDGLNFFSSEVPISESIRIGELPYNDYIICSTIMFVRLTKM